MLGQAFFFFFKERFFCSDIHHDPHLELKILKKLALFFFQEFVIMGLMPIQVQESMMISSLCHYFYFNPLSAWLSVTVFA